jgi:hypothetical protein
VRNQALKRKIIAQEVTPVIVAEGGKPKLFFVLYYYQTGESSLGPVPVFVPVL